MLATETNVVYIKIKIDKEHDVMNGFFVSEEKEHIENWSGVKDKVKKKDNESLDDEKEVSLFQKVSEDFEKSVNVFRTAMPFVMSSLPTMLDIQMDRKIRSFLKDNSRKIQSSTSEDGYFEVYSINIHHMAGFSKIMSDMNSIGQGIASMPDMFIVSLVSMYDAFLSQLIRTILLTRPEILSSSDKNIFFKDLVEANSIEAVRDKIIEKEIDSIIRSSHTDQINWLETKLNMKLRKDLKVWPSFVELCERRNLLTHTSGIVSHQYIKVCKDAGADVSNQIIGKKLLVPSKYHINSIQIITEFGSKLIQVIWRKLLPDDIENADTELNEFGVRLITQRRFKLASTMLHFGLHEMKKHGSEAVRRRMVVNYANAEKLSGNVSKANEILDSEDWSASTDLYKMCIAGVRDDVDTVVKMMGRAVSDGVISTTSLREWPVFHNVRSNHKFVEAFEREFSEKLIVDKETKNLSNSPDTIPNEPVQTSATQARHSDDSTSIH